MAGASILEIKTVIVTLTSVAFTQLLIYYLNLKKEKSWRRKDSFTASTSKDKMVQYTTQSI